MVEFKPVDTSELLLSAICEEQGTTVKELQYLCGAARQLKPLDVLELGTKFGRTAINLARHTPQACRIVCVDRKHLDHTELKKYNVYSKLELVTADTKNLTPDSFDRKFDFIFIDACHHFKEVQQDTLLAMDILNPGGYIFWHDYGKGEATTKMQVRPAIQSVGITPYTIVGTSLAYWSK